MKKNKNKHFYPYTSKNINSRQKLDKLLVKILSTRIKLYPRKIDKPVILYGAGNLGKMAKDFFNFLKIPFLYVVDKNAYHQINKFWKGIKIIHPDDVNETDKKNSLLVISIVTTPMIQLRNDLQNNGWKDVVFFYDVCEAYHNRYPLSNGWFLGNLGKIEKKHIKQVYFSLADNISRTFYLQLLAWRKIRLELIFKNLKINNDNRFFVPEITHTLHKNDVFVDCGAYFGKVVKQFTKISAGRYNEIFAIEPDYANLNILKGQLDNIRNTTIINCALSDINGKGKFYQGFGFASTLHKNGNKEVKIVTLDSLELKPTFIKMHLEGGELKALKGGIRTIKKYRPILVVTIYHNIDGLWRIPLYLLNKLENYLYLIRLHSWGGTGAVLYAIPQEKFKTKLNRNHSHE